jgi:hypothetical protein
MISRILLPGIFLLGFFVISLNVLQNLLTDNRDPVLSACLTICIGINYLMFKDWK